MTEKIKGENAFTYGGKNTGLAASILQNVPSPSIVKQRNTHTNKKQIQLGTGAAKMRRQLLCHQAQMEQEIWNRD